MSKEYKSPRIVLSAGIILVIISLVVGAAVLTVMERHAKAQHIQSLELSLKGTSQLIESAIESAYKASTLISQRPTLTRFLETFTTTNHAIDTQTTVNKTAPSFFEEGVSAIALFDEDGLRLSNSGIFSQQPELTVMLSDFPEEVSLIWDRKLLLRISLEVKKEGRVIGKVMTESPLPGIMKAFKDARLLGETGDLMLCAPMKLEMGCFPSTLNPNVLMMPQMMANDRMVPMAPSLLGESGYTDSSMDYRKQTVSAAYGPVGYYGLGVMLKVDMAELNGPLWTQLSYLIPLIFILIMLSLIFMRWRVAPMVLELTDAVNRLSQLNKDKDQQAEDLSLLQKEKDKAQKETDLAKSEFISTVSHELRTPLTSIKGALGLMKSGVFEKAPDKLPAIIDMAYKNADRLNHLIDDILDIERLNVGKMNFEMNSVNVSALLEESVLSNAAYGSEYGVTFVCSGIENPLFVTGDHHRLIQVMSNLLSNAAKFSHQGGQVDVYVTRHDGSIRVSVQDYGSGIPESSRATLFDKFTQVDSSDQRKKGGSGLGLNIAKMIVAAHDGHINFTSEVDKGTTFYVDLPELVVEANLPEIDLVVGKSVQNLLIVEDDPDIALLLEYMLQNAGYRTSIAGSAREAKALLAVETFDCMTLDLALPDQNGISLLNELRAQPETCHLPVVIISAYADKAKKELNGHAVNAIEWMQKPIDPEILTSRIEKAFRHSPGMMTQILHVEADEAICEMISSLFTNEANVIAARSLAEATALLSEQKFDLIILDLELPDGNGENLFPLLRMPPQESPHVVLVSQEKEAPKVLAGRVRGELAKSKTSSLDILNTIEAAIGVKRKNKTKK